MSTLNIMLSVAITFEAAIQNNLTKSWRFLREMFVVGFCYSETIVSGIRSNFTYGRSSRLQVFFKICKTFRPAALLKKFQYRFFNVKFAKLLRTPFLRNTSGGCFCYDSETYGMGNFICQFKLYTILINLVNVNQLIYRVQENTLKIKILNKCLKSHLFICLFSNNRN